MRFDDSLSTVLAADADTPFGAAAAWRQLVDLIGRGRVEAGAAAMARLRAIRARVPLSVRSASARALAAATPGLAIAALFAEEDAATAAPVLRAAVLRGEEWVALLPSLSPANRAVLRHRRDLPAEAERALESFAAVDFVLGPPPAAPVQASMRSPVQAEAPVSPAPEPVVVPKEKRAPPLEAGGNGYPVTALMERIAAYQRDRDAAAAQAEPTAAEPSSVTAFRFETDAAGAIRWVHGAPRAALIGLSLADAAAPGADGWGVDAAVAGAFRRRSAIGAGRLSVDGGSAAAGAWRFAAEPRFDAGSGRFVGYRGEARRPRPDEGSAHRSAAADGLRQLVHELRTPANAIAGFAELIEHEMVGGVAAVHRARALAVREQAGALVATIDDLDTAARIEGGALELRLEEAPLAPLLAQVVADLSGLAHLRGASIALAPTPVALVLEADGRAAERLVARLLAALLAAAAPGERVGVAALRDAGGHALIAIDRPRSLDGLSPARLLGLEPVEAEPGAPALGLGFSLRLVQSLAAELGGEFGVEAKRLTLRLPLAVASGMDLASSR